MTSEDNVKHALSVWLQQFKCKVAWEKKNKYQYPIFQCESKEKPDLLIQYNNLNYMCEVKHAFSKSNVYDSLFQTLRYAAFDHVYQLNSVPFVPDGYMVATENSIFGHLFNSKYETMLNNTDFHEGRKIAISRG